MGDAFVFVLLFFSKFIVKKKENKTWSWTLRRSAVGGLYVASSLRPDIPTDVLEC